MQLSITEFQGMTQVIQTTAMRLNISIGSHHDTHYLKSDYAI